MLKFSADEPYDNGNDQYSHHCHLHSFECSLCCCDVHHRMHISSSLNIFLGNLRNIFGFLLVLSAFAEDYYEFHYGKRNYNYFFGKDIN